MERLIVNPRHRALLERLRLTSCAAIVRHFGVTIAPGEPTAVVSMSLGESAVFYKQYEFGRPSWRFFMRASKALREWRSYEAFAQLDVPCAEPMACGEVRDAIGRLRQAFIITIAVPGAERLDHFVERRCSDRFVSSGVRQMILRDLARMTRRMHDGGFYHNDLHWRNVLVSKDESNAPRLTFIDCPRGRFERVPFLRSRRAIKDLATLDRTAARLCSAGERVRFLGEYLGVDARSGDVKQLAHAVSRYRSRRW